VIAVSNGEDGGRDGRGRGKYITAAALIVFVALVFLITIAKRW